MSIIKFENLSCDKQETSGETSTLMWSVFLVPAKRRAATFLGQQEALDPGLSRPTYKALQYSPAGLEQKHVSPSLSRLGGGRVLFCSLISIGKSFTWAQMHFLKFLKLKEPSLYTPRFFTERLICEEIGPQMSTSPSGSREPKITVSVFFHLTLKSLRTAASRLHPGNRAEVAEHLCFAFDF